MYFVHFIDFICSLSDNAITFDVLNNSKHTIMKNFTFLFMLLGYSLAAFAGVSPTEKKALVKFHQSTNGSQWTTKWDLNKPVEQWHGVVVKIVRPVRPALLAQA